MFVHCHLLYFRKAEMEARRKQEEELRRKQEEEDRRAAEALQVSYHPRIRYIKEMFTFYP